MFSAQNSKHINISHHVTHINWIHLWGQIWRWWNDWQYDLVTWRELLAASGSITMPNQTWIKTHGLLLSFMNSMELQMLLVILWKSRVKRMIGRALLCRFVLMIQILIYLTNVFQPVNSVVNSRPCGCTFWCLDSRTVFRPADVHLLIIIQYSHRHILMTSCETGQRVMNLLLFLFCSSDL